MDGELSSEELLELMNRHEQADNIFDPEDLVAMLLECRNEYDLLVQNLSHSFKTRSYDDIPHILVKLKFVESLLESIEIKLGNDG